VELCEKVTRFLRNLIAKLVWYTGTLFCNDAVVAIATRQVVLDLN